MKNYCVRARVRASFLGGRWRASQIVREVRARLDADPECVATIDMAGVSGISGAFADELLTPLAEAYGAETPRRVRIVNAAPDVAWVLRFWAGMFGLEAPEIEEET